MDTGHKAVIGHQQLSDAVGIVWRFSTHAGIASIIKLVNFAGGRGILVNHKIRRNKLANDQEIYMLT